MIGIKDIEQKFAQNHLADFLSGFSFINSTEAKNIFSSITSEDFLSNYKDITREDAQILLKLLSLAETFIALLQEMPSLSNILPQEVTTGIFHINSKVSPWKDFLTDCSNDPKFDAEYWIMRNGVKKQNIKMRSHLSQKLFDKK